jgi:hypothetical protein
MSQISGSVTLDVELGRVGDLIAGRVLAAVQDSDLVEHAAQLVAERLATPPVLWDGLVVSCTGSFETDQSGWYRFEFRAAATGARFALYADMPHQYLPGLDYTLTPALQPIGTIGQRVRDPEGAAAGQDSNEAGVQASSWFGDDNDR